MQILVSGNRIKKMICFFLKDSTLEIQAKGIIVQIDLTQLTNFVCKKYLHFLEKTMKKQRKQ